MNSNSSYIGINLYAIIHLYIYFSLNIDFNIYIRINTNSITTSSYQIALILKFEITSIFLST